MNTMTGTYRTAAGPGSTSVSRRDLLRGLGALALGVLSGCAPARIVLGLHDEDYAGRSEPALASLRAFVDTVVPGADHEDPNAIRAFFDASYPFARYRPFFLSDLSARARRLHGEPRFDRLDRAARTRVVRDGLAAGGVCGRLYNGAVYLTQVAVMAGIYDDAGGAPVIDFPGAGPLLPAEEQTYPDPARFFGTALTLTGNPA